MVMLCWKVPEGDLVRPKRDPKSDLLACPAVPAGDKVYYFAGYNDRKRDTMDQIDVSVFNTVTLRWTTFPPVTRRLEEEEDGGRRPVEVPSTRFGHTAVLIGSIVYIWGGLVNCRIHLLLQLQYWASVRGKDLDKVLYAFDVDTHRWLKPEISGFVPAMRYGHSACVLGKIMYVYGGNSKTGFLTDIYKLDTATMVWSLLNTRGIPPPASSGHSATIIGTKMFVFGGQWDMGKYSNNIRVFDTETNSWLNTPSVQRRPQGRFGHSAVAYKGELYIFGGYIFMNDKWQYNDLWKFNSRTFSWKKVEPMGTGQDWSSGRWCSVVRDRIILFGGYRDHAQPILQILDLRPSLQTLCKLAVIQYDLQLSCLPHNIRWELAAMTTETTSQIKVD